MDKIVEIAWMVVVTIVMSEIGNKEGSRQGSA